MSALGWLALAVVVVGGALLAYLRARRRVARDRRELARFEAWCDVEDAHAGLDSARDLWRSAGRPESGPEWDAVLFAEAELRLYRSRLTAIVGAR
jgi:hypothetical protein